MSLSPTINKIMNICLSDFKDSGYFYPMVQSILSKTSTKSPESLMKIISRKFTQESLSWPDVFKEVETILRNEYLKISDLRLFENNPQLLKIAINRNIPNSGIFAIEFHGSKAYLIFNRQLIAQVDASNLAMFYAKYLIEIGFNHFRVSVFECSNRFKNRHDQLICFLEHFRTETKLMPGNCSVDCYEEYHFHFEEKNGSHIYFKKRIHTHITQSMSDEVIW